MELKIDPEFRDKIPPLTDAEFEQLRENILEDGEVYEPICVWNGTIVDGHNRWKVIQENPDIPFRVKEMDFPDKWAAFDWVYKKQLGRRNLTDEQRAYMIGKMYEARKKSHGNHAQRGDDGKYLIDQNDPIGDKPKSTAEAIGREVGVAEPSVKRWEKFAKGVDAIRQDAPEVAEKILSGKSTTFKSSVINYPKLEPEQQADFLEAVKEDRPAQRRKGRESRINAGIREIVADMYNPESTPEYTLTDLLDEIAENGKAYIKQLTRTLKDREYLYTGDDKAQDQISEVITDVLCVKINYLMEGVLNAGV